MIAVLAMFLATDLRLRRQSAACRARATDHRGTACRPVMGGGLFRPDSRRRTDRSTRIGRVHHPARRHPHESDRIAVGRRRYGGRSHRRCGRLRLVGAGRKRCCRRRDACQFTVAGDGGPSGHMHHSRSQSRKRRSRLAYCLAGWLAPALAQSIGWRGTMLVSAASLRVFRPLAATAPSSARHRGNTHTSDPPVGFRDHGHRRRSGWTTCVHSPSPASRSMAFRRSSSPISSPISRRSAMTSCRPALCSRRLSPSPYPAASFGVGSAVSM